MTGKYEIAVVGSGYAGSLMAMIAVRLGHSVVLIDKGSHPRIVIGESSTPLANLLIEELAMRYDLPSIRPLTKWGTWQRSNPDIGCGLKRGFTFYHHERGDAGRFPPDRAQQLLVAASPNDDIADTHWYRADFDSYFVKQALELGVDYLDETTLTTLTSHSEGSVIHGHRASGEITLDVRFVIDASGPNGFLHRILGAQELTMQELPETQALHCHFSGVKRLEDISSSCRETPPYPVDDAAVHHVFKGGWIWVLRFNNGITSAGVAATRELAEELRLFEGEAAWRRLLAGIPALREQFAESSTIRQFTHMPRISFHTSLAVGGDWAMLPSAVGFVDPLLSTGFPLTLLGISRLAEVLESGWRTTNLSTALDDYGRRTHDELSITSKLIGALYANMDHFPVFSALTMLYFAAASYSETVRRLGKAYLAPSFLLHTHPVFGPAISRILECAVMPRSEESSAALVREIELVIEPFNIAGLGKLERRNWYPVLGLDLLRSAAKVQATEEEVVRLLDRCGVSIELPEAVST